MKVKKPQSKRKSTRLQKGIEKKVAAHQRKQRKEAKRDPTWKSRHPKDPGIPNSFPYKAQLLEEIEASRQREASERLARREAMRQQAREQGASEQDLEALDAQNDVSESQNRLGALMDSVRASYNDQEGDVEMDDEESDGSAIEDDEDDDEAAEQISAAFAEIGQDGSRKAFNKHFKQVLETCDILLYVLDARNPNGFRSKQVEEAVLADPSKRLILVLNKVDLVPEDVLQRWVQFLRTKFPTVPLAASSPAPNAHTFEHPRLTRLATASKLLDALKKWAGESQLKRSITAGVIGFPNVGKSSVINALLSCHSSHARACPVGAQAGVTTDVRRVKLDSKLAILDCPGIVFPSVHSTKKPNGKPVGPLEEHARLVLLNVMPPKHLGDCRPAVTKLVKRLQKQPDQMELFVKHYHVPPLPHTEDYIRNLLVHVGRAMGRLGRGGVVDLGSAAKAIITDWRDGRVAGWALPPAETTDSAPANVEVVSGWAQEFDLDGILGGLLG